VITIPLHLANSTASDAALLLALDAAAKRLRYQGALELSKVGSWIGKTCSAGKSIDHAQDKVSRECSTQITHRRQQSHVCPANYRVSYPRMEGSDRHEHDGVSKRRKDMLRDDDEQVTCRDAFGGKGRHS